MDLGSLATHPWPGQLHLHSWNPGEGVPRPRALGGSGVQEGKAARSTQGTAAPAWQRLGWDQQVWVRPWPHLPPHLQSAGGSGDPHALTLSLLGVQIHGAGLQAPQALWVKGGARQGWSDQGSESSFFSSFLGSELAGSPARLCLSKCCGVKGALSPPPCFLGVPTITGSMAPAPPRLPLTMQHEGSLHAQKEGAAIVGGTLHGRGELQGLQDQWGHGCGGLPAEVVKNVPWGGEKGGECHRAPQCLGKALWVAQPVEGALGRHVWEGSSLSCPSAIRELAPVKSGPTLEQLSVGHGEWGQAGECGYPLPRLASAGAGEPSF